MSSLKELRNRIASVKQTQKITSAMKMVAASKLRRAQEHAEQSRPYAQKMTAMLGNLAKGVKDMPGAPALLVGTGSESKHLLVVATADRGLCGGFNSSIARGARRHIQEMREAGKTVEVMCVGSKGRDALRRELEDSLTDFVDGVAGKRRMEFADAQMIAQKILTKLEAGDFDTCSIIFNRFKSAVTQILTVKQIVPVEIKEPEEGEEVESLSEGSIYEFEPEEKTILAELLPRNLAVQIYEALVENAASEQGARMAAMDSATRNAGEMIKKLTLSYNRTRQAMITKELIEIISGAEAV